MSWTFIPVFPGAQRRGYFASSCCTSPKRPFFVPFSSHPLNTFSIFLLCRCMLGFSMENVAESYLCSTSCICDGLAAADFHLCLPNRFFKFFLNFLNRPSGHNVVQTAAKPSCSTSLNLDLIYIRRKNCREESLPPQIHYLLWLPKRSVFAGCEWWWSAWWEERCSPEILCLFSLVFNTFHLRFIAVCAFIPPGTQGDPQGHGAHLSCFHIPFSCPPPLAVQ